MERSQDGKKTRVHKHADRNPAQKRGNEETKHEQH